MSQIPEMVRRRLSEGRPLADAHFDGLLTARYRKESAQHFTPVEVALRAAELLTGGKSLRILDIGAGVGKFCTVGALATPGLFTGAERRKGLVEEAERVREILGADRATFLHTDAFDLDWNAFDGIYLFNPFLEHLVEQIRLDNTVPFSTALFEKSFREVQNRLRRARIGTRVALYHGMGGGIPIGYRRLIKENAGTGFLELWEKKEQSEKTT